MQSISSTCSRDSSANQTPGRAAVANASTIIKPLHLAPVSPNVSVSTSIDSNVPELAMQISAPITSVPARSLLVNLKERTNSEARRKQPRNVSVAFGSELESGASEDSPSCIREVGQARRGYWQTVLLTPSAIEPCDNSLPIHKTIEKSRSTVQSKISVKRFACRNCKARFGGKDELIQHAQSCQQSGHQRPYVCSHCGACFRKNSNLLKHISLVELKLRPFVCSLCDATFGQKSNLTSHVRVKHDGERPYACSEQGCTRCFGQKSGLRAHISTVHNRERKFVCECGSAFGHRGDLNRTY
jgi:hypothetical protein